MTRHSVSLQKPMGIILEIDEERPDLGILVRRIDENGSTAAACRAKPMETDICVRDRLLEINGVDVLDETLENVMDMIIEAPRDIDLVLGRDSDSIIVRWSNGIAVAAKVGDSFRSIASSDAYVKIPYLCESGGCGTCEQTIVIGSCEPRYIRPCCARVPQTDSEIFVSPSDRLKST
ncbi:predicted protein [Chaetoceros tenuissimus]|uniref:PDZ domain-containing protein n=1 Tax=Chaetoceros tenuissimus TaxID=426638 RepID=A0AAD3H815_9STRA|nr:predicted protein [Chaetoceros tenuissimus]